MTQKFRCLVQMDTRRLKKTLKKKRKKENQKDAFGAKLFHAARCERLNCAFKQKHEDMER